MGSLGISSPDLTGECQSKCFLFLWLKTQNRSQSGGNPEALRAELPRPIYTRGSSQRPSFSLLGV